MDEVRQIVVHPAMWEGLEQWLRGQRIRLALIPDFQDPEDLPTYVMVFHHTGVSGVLPSTE